jgi:hypothetical protein
LSPSIKASFAGFQKFAFTSGDVATPASPMPPERESGVIKRNGTAVGICVELEPFVLVPPGPSVWQKASEGDNKVKVSKIYRARRVKNFIGAI